MSKLLYLDTNIYLDYCFSRNSGFELYGDDAYLLLQRTVSCEFTIIVSDIVLSELEKYLETKQFDDLFLWIKPKLVRIFSTVEDRHLARRVSIHYPDNLHYVISQRLGAKLISNDGELQKLGAIRARDL